MASIDSIFLDSLKSVVRDASLVRLREFGNFDHVSIKDFTPPNALTANYLSTEIFVAGQALHVAFTTIVSIESAIKIATSGLGLPEDKINDHMAADFIGELSNLIAGLIQAALQNHKNLPSDVVIGLPKKIQNHSLPQVNDYNQHALDFWSLSTPEQQFLCYSSIHVFDSGLYDLTEQLALPAEPTAEEDDFELF